MTSSIFGEQTLSKNNSYDNCRQFRRVRGCHDGQMSASPQGNSAPARRTQQQRRDETITRLLDAAADAVHELGYAGTTVQEICSRARLSQGALFRHFPTRKAILVATALRISENQISEFAVRFTEIEATPASLLEALKQVRAVARGRSNLVWQELIGAARTDEELRVELGPALEELSRRQAKAASGFAGELFSSKDDFLSILGITVNYFDAEAGLALVLPDPARDDRTLKMLARLIITQHPDPRAAEALS